MPDCTVTFTSLDKTAGVASGTPLLEAAVEAGLSISSLCGGDGVCGRCKMIVKEGQTSSGDSQLLSPAEVEQGMVLGCLALVQGDLTVEIPAETSARDKIAVDQDAQRFSAVQPGVNAREFDSKPLVSKVFLDLDEPTLDDNLGDCQRLERAISKRTGLESIQIGLGLTARIPQVLRAHEFKVTATIGRRWGYAELIDLEGGDASKANYTAVVDIGTSTIVVHLVDVAAMTTVDTQACFNSQAVHGREVTARIMAAERSGVKRLQELVVCDINRLVAKVAERHDVDLQDITSMVCAGNTTMTHFLLGLPPESLRRKPFIAASLEPSPCLAAEVGIEISPSGLLYCVPGIGSWVGGDITAGILATGLHEMEQVCMLIDIGTNGEIMIGNNSWLIGCSASVGPALEGASVHCGMVAEQGAIETVSVGDGRIDYKTIGNAPAVGLCGSGIIDLVAVLLGRGVISRDGKFVADSDPALSFEDGLGKYVLVARGQNAGGKEVYLTQEDIDNVITAKAAIFAATKIILDRLDLKFSDVHKVFLAGGFGSYINRENAVRIGLLPDLPVSRIHYVGNSSLWGAKLAALSEDACDTLREIRKNTTYYDLLGSPDYVDQFSQARFLPHTNIELFPSLLEKVG